MENTRMPQAYANRSRKEEDKGLHRGGQTKITLRSGSRTSSHKYRELSLQNTRAQQGNSKCTGVQGHRAKLENIGTNKKGMSFSGLR